MSGSPVDLLCPGSTWAWRLEVADPASLHPRTSHCSGVPKDPHLRLPSHCSWRARRRPAAQVQAHRHPQGSRLTHASPTLLAVPCPAQLAGLALSLPHPSEGPPVGSLSSGVTLGCSTPLHQHHPPGPHLRLMSFPDPTCNTPIWPSASWQGPPASIQLQGRSPARVRGAPWGTDTGRECSSRSSRRQPVLPGLWLGWLHLPWGAADPLGGPRRAGGSSEEPRPSPFQDLN